MPPRFGGSSIDTFDVQPGEVWEVALRADNPGDLDGPLPQLGARNHGNDVPPRLRPVSPRPFTHGPGTLNPPSSERTPSMIDMNLGPRITEMDQLHLAAALPDVLAVGGHGGRGALRRSSAITTVGCLELRLRRCP